MTEPSQPRSQIGHWLLLSIMAAWLATVPLVVTLTLQAAINSGTDIPDPIELVAGAGTGLQGWGLGLLSIVLTLGLNLLLFVPVYRTTRRDRNGLAHTTATILLGITAFQALNALALLPSEWAMEGQPGALPAGLLISSALRLLLGLSVLLLGLGWVEARRHNLTLGAAWRRAGLRLWFNPTAFWLALACGAGIVWPWVVAGSLGSHGTTIANLLQALPDGLNEEILFRGFAFAWLWRASRGRTRAAAASLLLFVAAQGATVLPYGDWGALLRFASALLLGLICTELTVRAGGSIWPAVIVHLLYGWFRYAFVDPRFQEEVLLWAARAWAPVAAGALGMLLWLGRKLVTAARGGAPRERPMAPGRLIAAVTLSVLSWAGVIALYLSSGAPGFHHDGFLIILEEKADLSAAASITEPVERREWVYHALVETADGSQAPLRTELERRGVPYRAHYLINMIEVQSRPGLRRAFADAPGVASVQFQPGVRRIPHSIGIMQGDSTGPQGVEWNVAKVGAEQVWELGFTGQGVIVGSADSGVVWDHPALKEAYLGWDGARVDHEYHWYDPWDGSTEASDDNGHGTHTTGTMVGLDGQNQIGIAPGAQWIACRNMRYGIGKPGSYLSCMEFLLAPFPFGGDPLHDGAPELGAQVVNNSWGCPPEEGCLPDTLRSAVENLRAAGQMFVTSAGNDGPSCGTVMDPPALYDAALTVGAINVDSVAASFSSRGPVEVGLDSAELKPDLAAPGLNIRSAVRQGYASLPGTSMAGPHVTGAVALLWSAEPALVGDLERTEGLLLETAQHLTVGTTCGEVGSERGLVCGCGEDGPDSIPNNVYGWGLLDAWAAVERALESP